MSLLTHQPPPHSSLSRLTLEYFGAPQPSRRAPKPHMQPTTRPSVMPKTISSSRLIGCGSDAGAGSAGLSFSPPQGQSHSSKNRLPPAGTVEYRSNKWHYGAFRSVWAMVSSESRRAPLRQPLITETGLMTGLSEFAFGKLLHLPSAVGALGNINRKHARQQLAPGQAMGTGPAGSTSAPRKLRQRRQHLNPR